MVVIESLKQLQQDLGIESGIRDLTLRQRPPRPVAGLLRLVQGGAELPLADRLETVPAGCVTAVPPARQGQGIDDSIQPQPVAAQDRALEGSVMDQLGDRGLAEDLSEGLEVGYPQGVDHVGLRGGGDLYQAQLGPVGLVADELGIDGDVRGAGDAPAERGECVVGCDEDHG